MGRGAFHGEIGIETPLGIGRRARLAAPPELAAAIAQELARSEGRTAGWRGAFDSLGPLSSAA